MFTADIMTASPITIQPESPLSQALLVMEENHCHHLPVISQEAHLIGIITAEACHRALGWQDAALESMNTPVLVRHVMTPAPIIVEPKDTATEAARLMLSHHLTALPVMRGETLVGIITTSDLLIAFMDLSRQKLKNTQAHHFEPRVFTFYTKNNLLTIMEVFAQGLAFPR
jgi:acetoin utilization protein AcuB